MALGPGCDLPMNVLRTLEGKEIVLGVTGSIAAVETIRLVHQLRRRGAGVNVVMSEAACGIVHPDALAYATGRDVITRISGKVEHVIYCGDGGSADLLVIAPCTANTIAKIAAGIDDTPVTTFATTAIGRGMPIVIVPAMHESMYRHPAVVLGIERLRSWHITVVDPRIEEGKAKIAGNEDIVLRCERALLAGPLSGLRVLITSGRCREPVDDVRVLTTRSTGLMGRALALHAFRLGADVTVVHAGRFPCVRNVPVSTAGEMREAVLSHLEQEGADVYVSAAAISDFAPERLPGKLKSGTGTTLILRPLPKLIDQVEEQYHPLTVAFKMGWETETGAAAMLSRGIPLVVTNTPDVMEAPDGTFRLVSRKGSREAAGTKDEVAVTIWTAVVEILKETGSSH
jgi:phosphopantothenoylcysteine decarboxylase/phosphopantothenate--cysteine ligase